MLCSYHNDLPHNKEERPGYLPKFVVLPTSFEHYKSPSDEHRQRRREGLRNNVEHIFIPVLRDSTSLSGKEEHKIGTGDENLLALIVVSPKIRMIEVS